jgi:hypothetical protein
MMAALPAMCANGTVMVPVPALSAMTRLSLNMTGVVRLPATGGILFVSVSTIDSMTSMQPTDISTVPVMPLNGAFLAGAPAPAPGPAPGPAPAPAASPLAGSIANGCVNFTAQGPFRNADSDSCDNIPNADFAGAIHRVVTAGSFGWVGTVNGGVWMTQNLHTEKVHWVPSTDQTQASCSSIAALAIDARNTRRLVAGCGNPSNYMKYQSQTNGVMITLDGGVTWNMTSFPGPSANGVRQNLVVSDVVLPNGTCILVSVRREYYGDYTISDSSSRGIWQSCDNGATWFVKI